MSATTVSVIIPAYNAARTVKDTIRSAVEQTLRPMEIIVVDDGSTDGTGGAVEAEFGTAVRLIRQDNAGVAEARNRGIAEARGEYIQFVDSDDMLMPTKLARSVEACLAQDADVSYGPARYVAADGVTPVPMVFPPLPSGDILLEWLKGTMANGTYGVASTMFVRRDALAAVGAFEKSCTPCEDWDMWIRLAAKYRFAALDEPLVIYRVVPGSLSSHALRMARGRLNTIRRARELPEVQARLSQVILDQLEAGRWHVLGMRLWESGERSEARRAFATANRLVPSKARTLYALLSYALPAKITGTFDRMLKLLRR